MIDNNKLQEILSAYKRDFKENFEGEKYKWEAIKQFQDNWDIDVEDFVQMLKDSLAKTNNLLGSGTYYPKRMIELYAERDPFKVKKMFADLFDETNNIVRRILNFKKESDELKEKYSQINHSHFQNENAISTYLWLRYPDKYYIYKFNVVKEVAQKLSSDTTLIKGHVEDNLKAFYGLYDELRVEFKKDNELKKLLSSELTDSCYPDNELTTLSMDVGYYISKRYNEKDNENDDLKQDLNLEKRYWWLIANPNIWHLSDLSIGKEQSYTLYNENGNKRRIFQNFIDVQVGDIIIGYEATPIKQIVAICEISKDHDDKNIYFKKIETLFCPIDYNLLKSCEELNNMEFFKNPNGSFV